MEDDVSALRTERLLLRRTLDGDLAAYREVHGDRAGADVVVTGRVTDASLVGPAVAAHGWERDDFDQLAGATAAGHVIECGAHATGGNFSGFRHGADLPHVGFPIAEVAADGSSVITKHPGTGGTVTVDTVTAQLVYEVGHPAYLGPDVTTFLGSLQLAADGPDQVSITGTRGAPPPPIAKVCLTSIGGYRNSVELLLTGLEIDAKAELVKDQVGQALAALPLDSVEWQLDRADCEDPIPKRPRRRDCAATCAAPRPNPSDAPSPAPSASSRSRRTRGSPSPAHRLPERRSASAPPHTCRRKPSTTWSCSPTAPVPSSTAVGHRGGDLAHDAAGIHRARGAVRAGTPRHGRRRPQRRQGW